MRKLVIYILMLMHVNTYMFFPMLNEKDAYELNGKQKDDINSVVEFVYQILLGHKDLTPEDEDDDQEHIYQLKHYQAVPGSLYVVVPPSKGSIFKTTTRVTHASCWIEKQSDCYYSLNAPPPEV